MNKLNHLQGFHTHSPMLKRPLLLPLISLALVLSACTGKIENSSEETGTEQHAGEQHAGEQHAGEQHAGEQHAGEQHAGEQHAGEQHAGEQHAGEQHAGEQHAGEQHAGEQHAGEQHAGEQNTSVLLDELDRTSIEEANNSEEVGLVAPDPIRVLERPRRRMNLDQLDRAIRQVSGGLFWSERRNNQDQNLFESLSATLGKPDFIQRTTEDLTPSALFMKFLDDASRQVCGKRIELDIAAASDPRIEPASGDVVLWGTLSPELSSTEDPEAINQQVRSLVLRFHSRALPAGESARLAYWRWLFETASLVDQSPVSGWRALCIGLINHPDFYSY